MQHSHPVQQNITPAYIVASPVVRVESDPQLVDSALRQAIHDGVPLLLPGLVAHWQACRLWQGPAGLLRLDQATQGETVTVMWSRSEVFIGSLPEMQPATMSMHEFLEEAGRAAAGLPGPHLYLAQHTLKPGSGVLQDAPLPPCLSSQALSSTNMWMCIRNSRSNIHYDPYANLLGVAVGEKQVSLWPSSATPFLYPAPLAGDSVNHSQVNFVTPDYDKHPLYRHAEHLRQHVCVKAGDALFIPDGYWHQVDSQGITIAINFWWSSALGTLLAAQPHQTYAALRVAGAQALGVMLQQLLEDVPKAKLTPSSNPGINPDLYSDLDTNPDDNLGFASSPNANTTSNPCAECDSSVSLGSIAVSGVNTGSGGGHALEHSGMVDVRGPGAHESHQPGLQLGPQPLAGLTGREQCALNHILAILNSRPTPGSKPNLGPNPNLNLDTNPNPNLGLNPQTNYLGQPHNKAWGLQSDDMACVLNALSPAELVHVLHVLSEQYPAHTAQLLTGRAAGRAAGDVGRDANDAGRAAGGVGRAACDVSRAGANSETAQLLTGRTVDAESGRTTKYADGSAIAVKGAPAGAGGGAAGSSRDACADATGAVADGNSAGIRGDCLGDSSVGIGDDIDVDGLSPLAAYLLTSKLEEADEQGVFLEDPQEQQGSGAVGLDQWHVTQQQFYQQLYGAVEEPEQVFASLLDRRQQLMQLVRARLMDLVLG